MHDQSRDAGTVELREVEVGSEAELQAVFVGAGDYFLRVTGRPEPAADAAVREARSAAATLGRGVALIVPGAPEDADVAPAGGAESLGSTSPAQERAGAPVGAIGWWAGHPEPDLALLGMLMIVREARGRGHARAALTSLEARLRADGINRLRTAVGAEDGESRAFVEALGFASTDERTRVDTDSGRLRIAFFEKEI